VRHLLISVTIVLLLSACGSMLNFTPERAAVQEVLRFGEPNLPVDPDSVQVLQTQAQGEMTLVLVAFQRGRGAAFPDECLAIHEVRRTALGWMTGSGGTGCGPIGGTGGSLDVGSGAHRSNESASSHTFGLVRDPLIATVEVTWDDGQVQQVPVVNSSYLVWREGVSSPAFVTGLNANDQEIFTHESPVFAPGEEMP
jgi:hypothetical protein